MIVKINFDFAPVASTRLLHIWLPDEYNETDERYPVMYMFDGHNLFFDEDATYGKSWGMKDFLENWSKKIIIVGMECSHEGKQRLHEYCPYNRNLFGTRIRGYGEATYQWIINDVKPYIDRTYRTYSHREATAIGGASMGGLMAIYGILAHNDVFSKAASLSTGYSLYEKEFARELKSHSINPDTRTYISWGEFEMSAIGVSDPVNSSEARVVNKVVRELQIRGSVTEVYFQYGGHHCEADWEKQVERFMEFLWLDRRHD